MATFLFGGDEFVQTITSSGGMIYNSISNTQLMDSLTIQSFDVGSLTFDSSSKTELSDNSFNSILENGGMIIDDNTRNSFDSGNPFKIADPKTTYEKVVVYRGFVSGIKTYRKQLPPENATEVVIVGLVSDS